MGDGEVVLGLLALGDVLHVSDEVERLRLATADEEGTQVRPDRLAAFVPESNFGLIEIHLGVGHLLEGILDLHQVIKVRDLAGGEGEQLLLGVAEHIAQGPVHAQPVVVEPDESHADRRVGKGPFELVFARDEGVGHPVGEVDSTALGDGERDNHAEDQQAERDAAKENRRRLRAIFGRVERRSRGVLEGPFPIADIEPVCGGEGGLVNRGSRRRRRRIEQRLAARRRSVVNVEGDGQLGETGHGADEVVDEQRRVHPSEQGRAALVNRFKYGLFLIERQEEEPADVGGVLLEMHEANFARERGEAGVARNHLGEIPVCFDRSVIADAVSIGGRRFEELHDVVILAVALRPVLEVRSVVLACLRQKRGEVRARHVFDEADAAQAEQTTRDVDGGYIAPPLVALD